MSMMRSTRSHRDKTRPPEPGFFLSATARSAARPASFEALLESPDQPTLFGGIPASSFTFLSWNNRAATAFRPIGSLLSG